MREEFCPALKDLVRTHSFCDVFREKLPRREEITFFRTGRAPSRLDKFYIYRRLVDKVSDVFHVASLSDHCGVVMSVELEVLTLPKTKRQTYWKLNTAILEEEDFLPDFVSFSTAISPH